ncbi:uncharacterized protein LACBIDRAFT_245790 [Laccaria bicolor S238N-H82]|uniref:Predicted protein n=1 Tax=Laccaria bicolor (strain S238N-H82 / ATCC MYA-4686) TaxID=486041 RepID=B0CZ40_LACBS|nr:uncharacterized protein LACBIDRAFT_245790 [Laccaria bicolor S238N-H82]EDR12997.1 predicted protein [Laccaria bicolor S238N-H82]|eukprot:XP_001877261.1 predicted protein [Laccaria bicolor S238N-H82]
MTAIVVLDPLPTPRPDHKRYTNPPPTKLGVFFWRWRVWFEATFALTVMEPWEQSVALAIYLVVFVLILMYLVLYLPQHMVVMQRRAVYYLWGEEGDEKVWW